MGILRTDNISGLGGRNAIKGSVFFSGYVDGASSDYLYLQDSDDLDMGTGDFTFECWLYAVNHNGTNNPNFMGIFSSGAFTAGGFLIQVNNNGSLRLVIPLAAGGNFEQSAGPSLWGNWNHIAVVKTSNVIKGFVNGTEVISASHSVGIDFAHGGYGTVGENCKVTYPGDYPFKGYISNLRLVKGTALYTSSFTPSTEELTAVDGTVLLCCQDNDDPTQEATGRHEIVGFRKCYEGKRYSNIATNGDLETGATTGWTNNGCSTFEVSNNKSHSGSYSLRCISQANGDNVSYSVNLNTNLRYKISAYINCIGPRGTSAKAKMKIGNAAGASQNYESQTVGYDSYKGFDSWEYVEWIGLATYSTTVITFNESSSNAVNEWYVDDLRVELWYPEEDQNILANPNFLTGATGWSFSSTPSGEYTISSNRLNVADNSRTNDAFATQQLFSSNIKEGRYRIQIDYNMSSGGFDVGIGNNRIWGLTGSNSKTWELDAGSTNSSFRIITNQHGVGYYNSAKVFRIAEPKRNNPVPPLGVDNGTSFTDNTKFDTLSYMVPPKGTTTQSNRGRALIAGGTNGGGWGTKYNTISYIQIQSGGIVKDFGDLSSGRTKVRSVSSSSRAVFAGGSEGASANNPVDTMEYVTIATTGNVTAFGDALESNRRPTGGVSNDTRGLFGGGYIAPANKAEVDHIVIASTGSVTDYGDLSVSGEPNEGSSNSTRGVWMGGGWGAQIEYVTIASTGSGADFGNIQNNRANAAGASSSTRALCAGGGSSDNDITFIQFASLGNDSDFGDLTQGRRILGGTSNGIRGIFAGGYTPDYNIIDYVNIATTGNAQDFGDMTTAFREPTACSDSHGGIS